MWTRILVTPGAQWRLHERESEVDRSKLSGTAIVLERGLANCGECVDFGCNKFLERQVIYEQIQAH